MRKHNHYVPLDTSELYPHRSNAAFRAVEELNQFLVEVLRSQTKPHELDELQEPLAEMSEELIELSSGGMSLRGYRRRCDTALRLCREAKASLPPLVRAAAMSAAQSVRIAQGLDEIIALVTKQWMAVQPPELDDEAQPDAG